MGRSQLEDWINGVSSAYVQHEPVDVFFDEPSRTRQEFADECDINILMKRYEATGVMPHVNPGNPQYLDVSEFPVDLQSALEVVAAAEDAFYRLPATVRAQFENDPVAFCNFAENPENLGKMREWGLAPPLGEPAPAPDAPASSPARPAASPPGSPAPAAGSTHASP